MGRLKALILAGLLLLLLVACAKESSESGRIPAALTFREADGTIIADNSDVKSATVKKDGSAYAVLVKFTDAGKNKFAESTARLIGQTISIYLDDEELVSPTVNSAIKDGEALIFGDIVSTKEKAEEIADAINYGRKSSADDSSSGKNDDNKVEQSTYSEALSSEHSGELIPIEDFISSYLTNDYSFNSQKSTGTNDAYFANGQIGFEVERGENSFSISGDVIYYDTTITIYCNNGVDIPHRNNVEISYIESKEYAFVVKDGKNCYTWEFANYLRELMSKKLDYNNISVNFANEILGISDQTLDNIIQYTQWDEIRGIAVRYNEEEYSDLEPKDGSKYHDSVRIRGEKIGIEHQPFIAVSFGKTDSVFDYHYDGYESRYYSGVFRGVTFASPFDVLASNNIEYFVTAWEDISGKEPISLR